MMSFLRNGALLGANLGDYYWWRILKDIMMKGTFRAKHYSCWLSVRERMGEEGGRKPSLDNPEYFLFPEDPPARDRYPGEPASANRFPGEPITMDRRARTVSQVNNIKLGR